MTIKTFLALLDGEWKLDENGCLMDDGERCPLWHVYEDHGDDDDSEEYPEDYHEAGLRVGLRSRDASAIAAAADNRGHPRLRKRLLTRVGLSGATTKGTTDDE